MLLVDNTIYDLKIFYDEEDEFSLEYVDSQNDENLFLESFPLIITDKYEQNCKALLWLELKKKGLI